MKKGPLGWIVFILLVVGGLNWGLVGLGMWFGGGNWNVVNMIFGTMPTIEALVYVLVGLAALYKLIKAFMKPNMSAPQGM